MGAGARKRERARRRAERSGMKVARPDADDERMPLARRPEYVAQMAAWRAAGCPENGLI